MGIVPTESSLPLQASLVSQHREDVEVTQSNREMYQSAAACSCCQGCSRMQQGVLKGHIKGQEFAEVAPDRMASAHLGWVCALAACCWRLCCQVATPGCCRHLSMQCCLPAAVRAKSVHQAVHCTAPSDEATCSFGSSSRGAAVHRGRPRSQSPPWQSAAIDWAAICGLRSWERVSGCRRCMSAASSMMELSPTSGWWQWSRMPRASSPARLSRVPAHSRDARLQPQGSVPTATRPNIEQRRVLQQACLCSK